MTLTALITPFLEDYSLDKVSLEKLLKLQFKSNIEGLVLLGTTGETPTLAENEQKIIIEKAIKLNKTGLYNKQIWVGVGDNSTKRVIQKIQELNNLDIQGFLIACPAYNKPQQNGLIAHFLECDKVSNKPIILYNVPSRTGINILPKTVIKIIKNSKNIKYIKEASGDINQIMEIIYLLRQNNIKGFEILSGDDMLTLPIITLGGVGVISVLSNLYPAEITNLVNTTLINPILAQNLHYDLLENMKSCFIETNPVPIKNKLYQKHIINTNQVRLPLIRMTQS